MPDIPRRILEGEKFNEWEVIGDAPVRWIWKHGGRREQAAVRFVTCRCSCGVIREVNLSNILRDASKDCGHGRNRRLSEVMTAHWRTVPAEQRSERGRRMREQQLFGSTRQARVSASDNEVIKKC